MSTTSQRIQTKKGFANILWDNGASLSFITNKKAKEEKLKGIKGLTICGQGWKR